MVRTIDCQQLCDEELKKHNLWALGWRTNFTKSMTFNHPHGNNCKNFIAYCDHSSKRLVFSIPHLNARSEAELLDTIKHEVAHALAGHEAGHGEDWIKACEITGAKPLLSAPSNPNAGRALDVVETKKEKPVVKAIQNLCPICGETAIESSRITLNNILWVRLICGHLVKHEQIKSVDDKIATWQNQSGSKTIFPYQVDGIKFIASSNGRCLIADEPGLGKTIQALGALYFYPEMTPALWVCKATLKLQALKEALDWCGLSYTGQIIEHGKMFILPGLKLYIVSMDLLRRIPTEKLEEIPFKTIIADEIQHFKNPDSTRTAELRKLVAKAQYFIPLSGTPWKNRGSEYFPVLNMLRPEMFPSPKHFKNKWVDIYFDKKDNKYREGGIRNIAEFREQTSSFILRRMRDDVLPDLPPINRTIRFVDMDEVYAKSYDKEEGRLAAIIKAAMIDGKPMKDIAQIIMHLKHITGLAKVKVAIDDCTEFLENSPDEAEKLTIFHHHIDVGDNLQKGNDKEYEGLDTWLVKNGWNKSLRLYGGRDGDERNNIIERFKSDIKNRVLIASTLASGEGLNIQFCQNAYMLERQWNPQNEEQAELRFSRPLTKSDLPEYLQKFLFVEDKEKKISIRIPYFIAAGTVDEILTNIVERKRLNFRKSMNVGDENITWDENELIRELAEAIVKKRFKK